MKNKEDLNKVVFAYKFFIVETGICIVFMFLIDIISGHHPGLKNSFLHTWAYLSFFASGFIMLLIPFAYKDYELIEHKKVTAERYNISTTNFLDFIEQVRISLKDRDYIEEETKSTESCDIVIFHKKKWDSGLEIVTVVNAEELTEEINKTANDTITDFVEKYYGVKVSRLSKDIIVMGIFCVQRTSSTFYRLVNTNLVQEIHNGRMICGISFGGKKLYLAQQKGGFGILAYKGYREKMLDILKFLFADL